MADMLSEIFRLQTELNDRVFATQGIAGSDGPLQMKGIREAVERGDLMVNDLPNQWLLRYTKAMEEELKELQTELKWKWWSRDKIDLQNIRVELVDILHFLVSAMIAAGLSPERVYDLYQQKHRVNVARQASGYSQETKTESDNRGVQ